MYNIYIYIYIYIYSGRTSAHHYQLSWSCDVHTHAPAQKAVPTPSGSCQDRPPSEGGMTRSATLIELKTIKSTICVCVYIYIYIYI